MLSLVLTVTGVALALADQLTIASGQADGTQAALLYGAAALLFVAGVAHSGAPSLLRPLWRTPDGAPVIRQSRRARRAVDAAPPGGGEVVRRPEHLPLVALTALFAVVAFLTLGDSSHPPLDESTVWNLCTTTRLPAGGEFTLLNVTAWLAAVGCGLAAFRAGSPRPARRDAAPRAGLRLIQDRVARAPAAARAWMRELPRSLCLTRAEAVTLAILLAAGAFFLYFRVDSVPREMTSDHAEKLLDAQFILDGRRPEFLPCNTGREAMQFYLIALMAPLTGVTYLTMKLGTAGLAWLSLPLSFALARRVAGTRAALLALALLVSMRWLWQVARVGLRFPFPPLFGAAVFVCLLRALATRRRNDFLLCGVVLGVAQHTYTALRLAPVAVIACVGIALAEDAWRRAGWARIRRLLLDTLLLFVITALVSLPLLRYAYDQPITFIYRGASRLASDTLDGPPPNLVLVFLGNVKNALLMFNWRGDLVWVNTIPGMPMLDPIGGALFVLGCAYLLYAALRYRVSTPLYLAALLLCGLLPSILSLAYPIENPSTVRSGMAIPVVAIILALPLLAIWQQLRRLSTVPWPAVRRAVPRLGAVGLAATLVATTAINFDQYFHVYAGQHERASQHSWYVARAINGFIAMGGRKNDTFILPGPNWIDWRLVAIQVGDIKWQALAQSVDEVRRHDGTPGERYVVLHPADTASLDTLRRWYPGAFVETHTLDVAGGAPWFVTVQIPPGATAQG